jgi:hypothetical protein
MHDDHQNTRMYWQWVDALVTSMETAVHSDPNNIWKYSGYKQFPRKYNELVSYLNSKIKLPPIIDLYNLDNIAGEGDTVVGQQISIFNSVHANACVLRAYLRGISGVDTDETQSLVDFLRARLRSAIFERPSREKEIQNAIEQLLIGRGLLKGQDYDREVGRVKISAKESTPDFIFAKLDLALEVKLAVDVARSKEIIDEINADIRAFSKAYKYIVFVVYDLGSIRDEGEFRRDLENEERVSVLIIKH